MTNDDMLQKIKHYMVLRAASGLRWCCGCMPPPPFPVYRVLMGIACCSVSSQPRASLELRLSSHARCPFLVLHSSFCVHSLWRILTVTRFPHARAKVPSTIYKPSFRLPIQAHVTCAFAPFSFPPHLHIFLTPALPAGTFQCETAARCHLLHLQSNLERGGR